VASLLLFALHCQDERAEAKKTAGAQGSDKAMKEIEDPPAVPRGVPSALPGLHVGREPCSNGSS
jgi:hypothetical protein